MQQLRTVTLLDLRLGLVRLTDEEQRVVMEEVAPIFAGVALRLLRERHAGRRAADLAANQAAPGVHSES